MSASALAEVEAAIAETSSARQWLSRKKSKQVSSPEDIDRLKSVAYAWFQTHKPKIQAHPIAPDLAAADAAFTSVTKATGKCAARTTYVNALKSAKAALEAIRTMLATAPTADGPTPEHSATTESPPAFSNLAHDARMQAILARRWQEVQACISARAYMAATVMMGGILESLLLARINSSGNTAGIFTAESAPRDRNGTTLKLAEWRLRDMIEVGHEVGWITKSAKDVGNVLRDFRNYIHPHKEHSDNVTITQEDARMFWEVTKPLCRQVLASVGKTP